MKNDMFEELLASVQEMDEVVRGLKAPAKVTEYPEPEVKSIREKNRIIAVALCSFDWC